MTALVHWPTSAGLLFGILIAATDPVSVLATLRYIGARGRLALVIEAESPPNDRTAAILFAIAIGFVSGEPLTYKAVAISLWTALPIVQLPVLRRERMPVAARIGYSVKVWNALQS